jgi:hypothetical protein
MKIEITKTVNGLNETVYRAYDIQSNDFKMIVGLASTIESVEKQVAEYKKRKTVTEEVIKIYEI